MGAVFESIQEVVYGWKGLIFKLQTGRGSLHHLKSWGNTPYQQPAIDSLHLGQVPFWR